MNLTTLQGSRLALIECRAGYLLFCPDSLALSRIGAKERSVALDIAQRISRIWPTARPASEVRMSENLFVTVCLTQRCNLHCAYCYGHGDTPDWPKIAKPTDRATFREYLRLEIDRAFRTKPAKLGINFFGGEPLLFAREVKAFTRLVKEMAGQHGIPVELGLTTNGTLLGHRFLDWALGEGIRIMVSIDSPAHLHDTVRSRGCLNATYAQIMDRVRGYQTELTAVTTITRQTPSIRGSLEGLLNEGFKEASFNIVHTRDPRFSICADDARRFLEQLDAEQSWFGDNANRIGNLRRMHNLLLKRTPKACPCSAGIGGFAIGPDCERYFCHGCVGDSSWRIQRNASLRTLKLPSTFGALTDIPECCCCWAKGLCGGDCWLIRRDYSQTERIDRCSIIRGLALLAFSTFPSAVARMCRGD